MRSTVEVQLADRDAWLESCDDDLLVDGHNLALLGDELIQFGSALPIGPGKFRLGRLLRGRRGTEWAMGAHGPDEPFALLIADALVQVRLSASDVGLNLKVVPGGVADEGGVPIECSITGEAMRPLSPVHLEAEMDLAGRLHCRWTRRSRLGWSWSDAIDAPLDHRRELYRVRLEGSLRSIEVECETPNASFSASDVATIGDGQLLRVCQVGDFHVSRPTILPIN